MDGSITGNLSIFTLTCEIQVSDECPQGTDSSCGLAMMAAYDNFSIECVLPSDSVRFALSLSAFTTLIARLEFLVFGDT